MATSSGWGTLGATIAGGNAVNKATAFEQGESLSAKTADALEQARARINENNAREQLGNTLQAIEPDPGKRAALVGMLQSKINPAEVANYGKTQQEVGFRNDIVNPATSDTDVARRAFALNQKGPVQALGEGHVINELHPVTDTGAPNLVTTDIGSSIAAQHNAAATNQTSEAALHRDQVANPQKYRTGLAPAPPTNAAPDGSQALPNDATLLSIARGNSPAPIPGSLNYNRLGGEAAMRRIEFFARNPDATIGGPAAAPVSPPAGVPPVPATGAGPAGDSSVKLPEASPAAAKPAGVGSTFDSTLLAQRRTAQNDLARKNGTGGNDDALNRTAGHLDVFEQLMKQSGNSNFVASNQLKNWYQQQTGKAWPGQASLAAHVLGTEIVKSMTSVGAGSQEERMGLAQQFQNARSLEQSAGAIRTAEDLLREQAIGTNQRVSGAGVKDYYTKYLTPTTRRRLRLDTPESAPPVVAAPAAAGGADNDPLGIRGGK